MNRIRMYRTDGCPYCESATHFLARKGVHDIEKINVDALPEERVKMMEITGRRTVPQIFIGEHHVGGYDDLVRLERAGELDGLLRKAGNVTSTNPA